MVFDDPAVVETTVLSVAVDTLDPMDPFAEDKSERTEERADDTEDNRDSPDIDEAELPENPDDPDDPEDPEDDALILTTLRVNYLPPLMVTKTKEADNKISEVTGGTIVTTYNQYHMRSYRRSRLQRINNSSELSSDTPHQNPK
jgi:hypothetical protein